MLTNRNYVVKEKKFEVPENPENQKIDHIRQSLYDTHAKVYKSYGRQWRKRRMLDWASVWTVEWAIFLRTKREKRRLGKIWQLCKPKLRVNRLCVIRIRKVCESMRFDSGPEVFVRVNRNYVLTEYVLNENDCICFSQASRSHFQALCAGSSSNSMQIFLQGGQVILSIFFAKVLVKALCFIIVLWSVLQVHFAEVSTESNASAATPASKPQRQTSLP